MAAIKDKWKQAEELGRKLAEANAAYRQQVASGQMQQTELMKRIEGLETELASTTDTGAELTGEAAEGFAGRSQANSVFRNWLAHDLRGEQVSPIIRQPRLRKVSGKEGKRTAAFVEALKRARSRGKERSDDTAETVARSVEDNLDDD